MAVLFQTLFIVGVGRRHYVVQKFNDAFNSISGRFLSSIFGVLPSLVLIPAQKDNVLSLDIHLQISNYA